MSHETTNDESFVDGNPVPPQIDELPMIVEQQEQQERKTRAQHNGKLIQTQEIIINSLYRFVYREDWTHQTRVKMIQRYFENMIKDGALCKNS